MIALNDFEKAGVVAEVKRNPDKINYTLLALWDNFLIALL